MADVDRIPPHSLECEICVLGSMLLDRDVIDDVLALLRASDFYRDDHRIVFGAILACHRAGYPVDLVVVPELLRKQGRLEDVGGVQYLAELVESVPSAANAMHYAEVVKERSLLRGMISACDVTMKEAYEASDDTPAILARAEARVLAVGDAAAPAEAAEDNGTAFSRIVTTIAAGHGQRQGLTTGIPAFDDMTGGLLPEYIVVAARPSVGKTAWATGAMVHIAKTYGPVFFGSVEMPADMLRQRILCQEGRVDNLKIRSGTLATEDHLRLADAGGVLGGLPLIIDDFRGRRQAIPIAAQIRRAWKRKGIKAAFIDYVQKIDYEDERGNENSALTRISNVFANLKDELKIPIVMLAQLNRDSTKRSESGFRPRMNDLRGSGSLEQDADVLVLIHREDFAHKNEPNWRTANPDKIGKAELIIEKQRNGPTCSVPCRFTDTFSIFGPDVDGNVPAEYSTPDLFAQSENGHPGGVAGATHAPPAPEPVESGESEAPF